MKVAFLIDSLRAGGKERQAVTLLVELARRGVEILVISLGEDRFFEPALQAFMIRCDFLSRQRRWDPALFFRLDRVLSGFRPDLIHTTCWMTSFYALAFSKLRRIPVINGSIRNCFTQRGFRSKAEQLLLRLAEARISNSRAGFICRGFAAQDFGNYVIYNGFDCSRLSKLDSLTIQKMNSLAAGKRIVGMVAQFKDDRDYPTFFEAARLILQKRSDVVFFAVGNGKNFDSLQLHYASETPGIHFLGLECDIESVVSSFEIGVLATFTEGISNAIMEYMVLGKPVVATDGGGTAELLIDGVTGYLVQAQQPRILAERIDYLLEHPELAAALGNAGKERIIKHFSLERLAERTLETYRNVLEKAECNGSQT